MINLPPPQWLGYLIGVLVAITCIVFAATGCKSPYGMAWRTLDAVQKARDLGAAQLGKVAHDKHQACLAAHKAKMPEYAACIKPYRDALRTWQDVVRPSVNSAIQITATGVQIAERAKDDPKLNWIELLKPAVCAISRGLRAFGHLLPDKASALLKLLPTLEGVSCGE